MQPCLALPLFRRQAGRRRSWLSDNSRGKSTPAETCANRHAPALLIRNFPVVSSKTRYLIWKDRQGHIYQLPITRDLVIGSSPDCDIVLNAPGVAPRHCLIRHHPDADILIDLHSTHGTIVNGEILMTPRIFRLNDVLIIGTYALNFSHRYANCSCNFLAAISFPLVIRHSLLRQYSPISSAVPDASRMPP